MPKGVYKHQSQQGFQKGNSFGKLSRYRKIDTDTLMRMSEAQKHRFSEQCVWNKGLTKETDIRVAMSATSVAKTWHKSIDKRRQSLIRAWAKRKLKSFTLSSESREAMRRGGRNSIRKQTNKFISKQQQRLFEILRCVDQELVLEHRVEVGGRAFFLDIANVRLKIDVEYDGAYWHKSRNESDANRDLTLTQLGWTVIRVKEEDFIKMKV